MSRDYLEVRAYSTPRVRYHFPAMWTARDMTNGQEFSGLLSVITDEETTVVKVRGMHGGHSKQDCHDPATEAWSQPSQRAGMGLDHDGVGRAYLDLLP